MGIIRAGLLLAMAVFLAPQGSALAAGDICSEPVKTATGLVSGISGTDTATCAWQGVPYAAPPVGELRWKAPQPAAVWTDVREAKEFSPRCLQRAWSGVKDARNLEGMSEDCLYLNVWRPKKSGQFPVMVWIHGGGLVIGSGRNYRGDRLAEFGQVVVVTLNYRLNVFGYFSDPALRAEDPNSSVGNYGFLDQVAVLRWVHDNISNFGGDPDNVTIFGESAGGWSVCTMLATPLNRGLFHRAILESGSCEVSGNLEPGYEHGRSIAAKLGCAPEDLHCLRSLPAKKLLNRGVPSILSAGFDFAPIHDGYLLTDTPLAMIRAGNFNRVPFIAGSTRDEVDAIMVFIPGLIHARPAQYGKLVQRHLDLSDSDTQRVLELYPLSQYQYQPIKAFGKISTDADLGCPTYLGIAAMASEQQETFYYRFDYDEMKYGKYLGAIHSMEIPFVFNSLDWGFAKPLYNSKNLPAARELSRIMMGYWTNFAKTGNPNGPGLPSWPQFKLDSQLVQVLDTSVRTEPAGVAERCEFWEQYLDTHQSIHETLGKPKK